MAAASNNDLVGKRLSILYRIEDETHQFSEAVGLLERVDNSVAGELLQIRKRNGDLVEVPASHIVKLKIIPQRPERQR